MPFTACIIRARGRGICFVRIQRHVSEFSGRRRRDETDGIREGRHKMNVGDGFGPLKLSTLRDIAFRPSLFFKYETMRTCTM